MTDINPVCSDFRTNCFACKDGRCGALHDTNFLGKPCPFYATKEMFDLAQAKTRARLLRIGRPDLLKYVTAKKMAARKKRGK